MPSSVRISRSPLPTLLGAVALAQLVGCIPVGTDRVAVEIRSEADQRPVVAALVTVEGVNPVHPFRVGDYLRSKPGNYPSVQTDAAGRAIVTAPTDRPFQMTIILPGLIPVSIFFSSGLNGTALPTDLPTGWQRLEVGAEQGQQTPRAELRLTPAP